MEKTIYHGSDHIIEKPKFGYGKPYNDYGIGFYCTQNPNMAKEWGVGIDHNGYANRYKIECDGLTILDLNAPGYTMLHWLTILLENREFDTSAPLAAEAKEYPVSYTHLTLPTNYLVNDLHYPLETAWQWFVTSELSARFEQGDCSVLVGLSGVELARAVLEQAGEVVSMQKPSYAYDRSPEYWTGWALAYYQWLTSLRFAEIEQAVSITKVRLLYTPYHEMDVRQFADKMNELYRAAKPETNLKAMRTLAGLSQSELAVQADVPVRTIQQYEQRQKDINKAQAETLLRLARALNCNVEDLMEKVPPLNFK